MTIRRSGAPDPLAPVAIDFRTMGLDDIPAGLRLCRASRWNQVARDWELFLASGPDGCRVAVDDKGEVVGSVATIRYGAAFSWVAMVLVDPGHRGAGIGSRLLQEALLILDDVTTIRLDATPAGFSVYDRAGFLEEYRLQRMQRAPGPVALPAGDVRPMTGDDFPAILAWDLEAFGADRCSLLAAFRRDAPEYCWVSGRGGIDGYLFGRHGHAFEHMGPLVARDEGTARKLISACLGACSEQPFILDVPERDSWTTWLATLGFTVQRPFIRMYRGTRRYRDLPDQTFAILGPEFG